MSEKRPLCVKLATLGPIGLIPEAPGTFGSIPGVLVGAMLYVLGGLLTPLGTFLKFGFLGFILLALISWSYVVIDRAEAVLKVHDDKRIVLDELVGQAIALAFFPPRVWILVTGFFLFRLFDIWKPGPVGWLDKNVPGAGGTLFDDVLAGVFAGGCLGVLYFFFG